MKNIMKQLGKAISYLLLFFGMQMLVSFIVQFIYSFKMGMEAAVTGAMPDTQALVEGMMEYLVENSNWIVVVSNALTLLVLWVFFKVRKKKFCQEVTLNRFNTKAIMPIILLGIATAFFILCVLELLPIPESMLEAYMESASGLTSGSAVLMILSTVIMAPVVEEVVFRGLILSRLTKAMNVWAAIIVSSLLFGLVHGQMLWMAYTFLLGMLLAFVAVTSKSVGASILLHMAFNAIGIFGDYIHLSSNQMVIVTIVSFVVMMVCLYFVIRIGKIKKDELYDNGNIVECV